MEDEKIKKILKEIFKKILKIILIILFIIIILFLIHTIRNFMIVSKLQEKVTQYVNSSNYHIKIINEEYDDTVVITNYYKKDNKEAYFLERRKFGEVIKISVYSDGTKNHRYTETPNNKVVNFDESKFSGLEIENVLENDNIWQKILSSMIAQIESERYNKKICYKIENYLSHNLWWGLEENEIYIEKDTGLLIKSDVDYSEAQYEYEFNNVDDTIFIEPDISQYQKQ